MNNFIQFLSTLINLIFGFLKTSGQAKTLSESAAVVEQTILPLVSENNVAEIIKPSQTLQAPVKTDGCLTGSEFMQTIINIGPDQRREDLIFKEFKNGNIPDFMRNMVEVEIVEGENTLKYYVIPDVLSIGTDSDFCRIPMSAPVGKNIADMYSCMLPTKKMCDQIWKAANIKLEPILRGPPYDNSMQLTNAFIWHNQKIEEQRVGRNGFLTGHKKDVVICKGLLTKPDRIGIYGWYHLDGVAIQGPNVQDSAHNIGYYDYAHSIRLISKNATLNGNHIDMYDLLKDPNLCHLISDEGAYDGTKIYK